MLVIPHPLHYVGYLLQRSKSHNLVLDCTGSCKSSYHAIKATEYIFKINPDTKN